MSIQKEKEKREEGSFHPAFIAGLYVSSFPYSLYQSGISSKPPEWSFWRCLSPLFVIIAEEIAVLAAPFVNEAGSAHIFGLSTPSSQSSDHCIIMKQAIWRRRERERTALPLFLPHSLSHTVDGMEWHA